MSGVVPQGAFSDYPISSWQRNTSGARATQGAAAGPPFRVTRVAFKTRPSLAPNAKFPYGSERCRNVKTIEEFIRGARLDLGAQGRSSNQEAAASQELPRRPW